MSFSHWLISMLDWILSMLFDECLTKLQCVVVGERDANKYGEYIRLLRP